MKKVNLKVKLLRDNAVMPSYATNGAAGFDLSSVEVVNVLPQKSYLIPTGLSVEIPEGYELQIRPRSGLSFKTHIRIANSPGTIDSDYRGELMVLVTNTHMTNAYKINIGDRVAQAVLAPVTIANFILVDELSETERGEGGFGSTGA